MGTGYSISVGYLSGNGFKGSKLEAMSIIVEAFDELRTSGISRVAQTAKECGAPEWADGERIEKFVAIYNEYPENGCPWNLIPGEDGIPYLHIMCSGKGQSRAMKEKIARTFCRFLLTVADLNDINLDISVK